MFATQVITYVVTLAAWMTPMPTHTQGLIDLYGGVGLAEANAEYHGYSLDGYDCGLAVMSPADLGRTVWVRADRSPWIRCLAVDVSARKDFYANVKIRQLIAEVDIRAANVMQFQYGKPGEAYVGDCPPRIAESVPVPYKPPIKIDWLTGDLSLYPFKKYPEQDRPKSCNGRLRMDIECWLAWRQHDPFSLRCEYDRYGHS